MSNNDLRPHLHLKDLKSIQDRKYKAVVPSFARNEYAKHSQMIFDEALVLKSYFESIEKKVLTNRRYFRVEIPEECNIWSTDGKNLANNINGTLMATPDKNIGHFSTLKESFYNLLEQLKTYQESNDHRGKTKFNIIENIGKIPANEKISKTLQELIDTNKYNGEVLLTLYPDLAKEDVRTINLALKTLIEGKGGKFISEVNSSSGTIIRAKINQNDMNELIESFMTIQSAESVDDVISESALPGEEIENTVIVNPNTSTAKVCIFDTGVVRNSRFMNDSMVGFEEPLGAAADIAHGTFVASRIIYGNSLRESLSSGIFNPDVKVLSICMITRDELGNVIKPRADDFVRVIRDTVERWHREIKVYNISMNFERVVDSEEVSLVAAEIDNLIRRYKVTFVLSTGNIAPKQLQSLGDYPSYFSNEVTRIYNPAESLLAITVGSISDRENTASMSRINDPSPFTRRGPGFQHYRKPDMVAEGGNLTSTVQEFSDLSVAGIGPDGNCLNYGIGTSYSAPLISRLAAKLYANIPRATPELIKALLIHSCNLSSLNSYESLSIDEDIFVAITGNGIPETNLLLNSNKWIQNYIYTGNIGFRKILKLPFYVPSILTNRRGLNKIQIKYTIVSSPETKKVLKSGYCKSHLRSKLSKLDQNGNMKDILSDRSSKTIKESYSSVIKDEKILSRSISSGFWEITIEHVSRWTLENDELPFALILSICDPKNDPSIDIYQAIKTEIHGQYEDFITVQDQIRTRL
ncbi:MAG: S8 family peptidase [Proteobacteria bacterium]|nr:S8 family peptidase [Pseudomonadota bacterium]